MARKGTRSPKLKQRIHKLSVAMMRKGWGYSHSQVAWDVKKELHRENEEMMERLERRVDRLAYEVWRELRPQWETPAHRAWREKEHRDRQRRKAEKARRHAEQRPQVVAVLKLPRPLHD